MRLRNRVALITGGGRGIGQATAIRFAQEGAAVAVLEVHSERAKETVHLIEKLGGRGLVLNADVSRADDVRRAVQATVKEFGKLDILFNNAAISGVGRLTDTDEARWDLVMGVDLKGAYLTCREAIPIMIENGGGAIVNTASASGLAADYALVAYCTAKAGLINLTRSIAVDYADKGIRCNCVCPGATETPMLLKSFTSQEARKRFEEAYPMKRVAQPAEIANAVLFLVSDEASFITGAVLPVDGGITARTAQPPWLNEFLNA